MALTDEDKKWFHDEIQHLKVDLRGEIQELKVELLGEIQHAKDGLRGEIQHAKDESIAASRDMQTEVITFIGSMTEPLKLRFQHL